MKKIDTVIFDLDGTLLDTLKDLQNAINYIQGRYGYPLHTMEQVRSHVGNGIPNLVAKSIPEEKAGVDGAVWNSSMKSSFSPSSPQSRTART